MECLRNQDRTAHVFPRMHRDFLVREASDYNRATAVLARKLGGADPSRTPVPEARPSRISVGALPRVGVAITLGASLSDLDWSDTSSQAPP